MSWRLKRTNQCAKCPFRKGVDPHTIPHGYSVEKHQKLAETIAPHANLGHYFDSLQCGLHIMACHEEHEAHCIGWLANQLGPGNNIALRISMLDCENVKEVKTYGEQHQRFEDTLPQNTENYQGPNPPNQ